MVPDKFKKEGIHWATLNQATISKKDIEEMVDQLNDKETGDPELKNYQEAEEKYKKYLDNQFGYYGF